LNVDLDVSREQEIVFYVPNFKKMIVKTLEFAKSLEVNDVLKEFDHPK